MTSVNSTNVSLSGKVVTGAFWLLLFQVLDNGLGFLRLLILARLLSPLEFGLVGIAWLVLQIINTFTQTGIHQTLIYKKDAEAYLHTAWTYLALRGIILFSAVYFFAPFLGSFFNSTLSIPVIQAVGFTLLCEGFINIGVIYFQKNLTFNKQFIYQLTGNFADFVVAICLALITHNVWAIVGGMIANSLVRLVLSYILSTHRPKVRFDKTHFREMNNYGKWIFGSNILQFLYSQGDDILVGRILGPLSLGYYQLAYRISNLPATQITHLISTIMFPTYAKIQDSRKQIGSIYIVSIQVITFLSFYVGAIIICFAQDFTILFIGEKWLPMVTSMQILTVWGVLRSIGATTGPVWQALGTPKYTTQIQTIQVVILVAIIYPLTVWWGINGTAIAVVIAALIPNIIAIIGINKSLHLQLKLFVSQLLYPTLASILLGITYYIVRGNTDTISYIFFFFLAIVCTTCYLLVTIVLQKFGGYDIYKNIFRLSKSLSYASNNKYLDRLERIIT